MYAKLEDFHFLKIFSNDRSSSMVSLPLWPMAQYRIEDESLSQLQIISSAAMPPSRANFRTLCQSCHDSKRLYTFLQGKSGRNIKNWHCSPHEFINRGLLHTYPEHGSVGPVALHSFRPYRPHPDWRRRGLLPRQEKRYGIRFGGKRIATLQMHIREGLQWPTALR